MKFSSEIEIKSSVRDVFQYTLNPKNLSKWIDGFQMYKPEGKGKARSKGSTGTHIYKDAAGTLEVKEKMEEVIKDKSFTTHLSHKNMDTTLEFRFLNQGGSTKVVTDTQVRLKPAVFNLFSFLMKSKMKQQQQADLRRLKNAIEARK